MAAGAGVLLSGAEFELTAGSLKKNPKKAIR